MKDKAPLQRNLEILLDAHDLKMRALSVNSGLEETTVKRIVSGRARSPRTETVAALAQSLGTTVDQLTTEGAFDHLIGQKVTVEAGDVDGSGQTPSILKTVSAGPLSVVLVEQAANNVLTELIDAGYLQITSADAAEIATGIAAHTVELSTLPPDQRTAEVTRQKAGFVKAMLEVRRLRARDG